jgi:hypothetical protein
MLRMGLDGFNRNEWVWTGLDDIEWHGCVWMAWVVLDFSNRVCKWVWLGWVHIGLDGFGWL